MQQQNSQKLELLGSAPIGKLFWHMILPCVFSQMVFVLNNIIDRMWVGHISGCGSLCLTAVGVCMPISVAFTAFAVLISSGMAPQISILLGKNDTVSANKTSGASITTEVILSAVCVLVTVIFCDTILNLVGCGKDSLPYAHDYLMMSSWGYFFINMTLFFSVWLSSLGEVKASMTVSLISVLVHMVLDPIFIFVLDMGITGAALAADIGGVLAVAYFIYYYIHHNMPLQMKMSDMHIRMHFILPVVGIGISTWLNVMLESFSMFIVNGSLQKFGGDTAVAVMSLYFMPLVMFTYLVNGLQMGAQPLVSYNFGRGDRPRWVKAIWYFMGTSFGVSLTIWIVLMAIPELVWACFTNDMELRQYAVRYGYIYFSCLLINGIQASQAYTLRFLNFPKISLFIGILKKLLLLLPLLVILPMILPFPKIISLFMVIPVTDVIGLIVTVICFVYAIKSIK